MSGDLIPKRIVRSDGVETTVWVKPNASDQAASRLAGISVTPVVGTEKEARRKRAAESGIDPDEWAGDFTDAGLIRQYRSSWKHAARLQERGDTDLGPQDEMAAVRDEAQQRGLDLPSDAEIAERMRLEQLIASESADGVAPDDYDAGDPLRRALASVRRGHTYEEAAELVWGDWSRAQGVEPAKESDFDPHLDDVKFLSTITQEQQDEVQGLLAKPFEHRERTDKLLSRETPFGKPFEVNASTPPSLPEARGEIHGIMERGISQLPSEAGSPSINQYAEYLDDVIGSDPVYQVRFSESMRRLEAAIDAGDRDSAALAASQAIGALDATEPNNEGLDAESASVVQALTESLDLISDDLHRTLQRIAQQR